MGKCFLHGNGGGAPLNFKVVRYESKADLPATAKENTIAVFSGTDISCWKFSPSEPTDPINGMVWFLYGTTGFVSFNALRKNAISLYPISASQYIGGDWVNVQAGIYQNDAFDEWFNGTIYNDNWYADYKFVAFPSGQNGPYEWGAVTIDNDSNPVTVIAKAGHGAYIADVDVTDYNTLEVCYELSGSNGWINFGFATDLAWRDNTGTSFVGVKSHSWTNVAKTTQNFDISALSGKYPFKLNMYNSTFKLWSLRLLK